jgi:DNA-binding transcriptional LysR family regulator
VADKFSSMTAFVKTVDEKGFSAAARQLHVATSSVTRLVDQLEKQLGTTLLNRSTRKITLTNAGDDFYQQAIIILRQLALAEENIRDLDTEPRGKLHIAMPTALGRLRVMPIINQFMHIYPDIYIIVHLSDDEVDIQAMDVDIAVRIGPLPTITTLIVTKISSHSRFVVGAKCYFDVAGRPTHPKDLDQHKCLLFAYGNGVKHWNFTPKLASESEVFTCSPKPNMVASNSEVLLDAVIDGLGIALLPDWLVENELSKGTIESVLTDFDSNPHSNDVNVYALFSENRRTMKKVRLFIDFLKVHYALP